MVRIHATLTSVTGPRPPCRTGVWLFPSLPAPDLVDAIRHAEALGLDDFWLGDEGLATEPFSVLAAAAACTTRIRLGIAVTNPYVRPPTLTVSTARTIAELAGPGRFALGVGAGGSMALDPFGLQAIRPVHAITGLLDAVAEVGSGIVRTAIGARGERLNRLASERADEAFLAGMPPFRYDETIRWCRSVRPIDIALYPSVAFTPEQTERSRPHMIWQLANAPTEMAARFSLDPDAVARAAVALQAGDEGPARDLLVDDVLGELLLVGPPATVAPRLTALVERHRPASIGLALLEPTIAEAAEALHAAVAALR